MEWNDIKKHDLPIDTQVLVNVVGTDDDGIHIDIFTKQGASDGRVLNGNFYTHNISHWMFLPDNPVRGDARGLYEKN